jgi:hypothetical protein
MSDSETAFRGSYPIDFDLFDKDQQNVLYIEDRPADQQVKLEITNASEETILLKDLSGNKEKVGADAFHFALRFRPGTLADDCLAGKGKIKLSADSAASWAMSGPEKDKNGMDLLYFLANTKLSFEPQKKISIGLLNVGADGAQGARGTRVELLYDNMAYQSTPEHNLKSTRIAHLSIINHRGKTHIPLHVGFVGSNTVLNDGKSPNTLKLRLTNLLRPDAAHPGHDRLVFKYNADEAKASKLILSFDTGKPSEEWALGSEDEVKAITIDEEKLTGWTVTKPKEGLAPEWILQPASKDQILEGTKHIELRLSEIITGYPTGQTHLYLRYENIPGYWDGQFVCVIEKQPLVYRDIKVKKDNLEYIDKRVGIGTTSPNYPLSLGDNLRNTKIAIWDGNEEQSFGLGVQAGQFRFHLNQGSDRFSFLKSDDATTELVTITGTGNVGIGTKNPQTKLEVTGNITTNVAKISDDPHGSDYAAFSHKNQGTTGGYALKQHRDGACYLNSPAGQDVNFSINNEGKMILKSNGNVGIGTTSPNYPLSFGNNLGNTKIAIWDGDENKAFGLGVQPDQFRFHLNQGSDRFSFLNGANATDELVTIQGTGKVGIGTTDPKAKLDVHGTLKMNGQSPIVFRRYTDLGDDITKDTGYRADEYTAAVVGFRAFGGDINEWGGYKQGKDTIKVYMDIIDGVWKIKADFISEKDVPETWSVDVMFVRNELCERIGYEG